MFSWIMGSWGRNSVTSPVKTIECAAKGPESPEKQPSQGTPRVQTPAPDAAVTKPSPDFILRASRGEALTFKTQSDAFVAPIELESPLKSGSDENAPPVKAKSAARGEAKTRKRKRKRGVSATSAYKRRDKAPGSARATRKRSRDDVSTAVASTCNPLFRARPRARPQRRRKATASRARKTGKPVVFEWTVAGDLPKRETRGAKRKTVSPFRGGGGIMRPPAKRQRHAPATTRQAPPPVFDVPPPPRPSAGVTSTRTRRRAARCKTRRTIATLREELDVLAEHNARRRRAAAASRSRPGRNSGEKEPKSRRARSRSKATPNRRKGTPSRRSRRKSTAKPAPTTPRTRAQAAKEKKSFAKSPARRSSRKTGTPRTPLRRSTRKRNKSTPCQPRTPNPPPKTPSTMSRAERREALSVRRSARIKQKQKARVAEFKEQRNAEAKEQADRARLSEEIAPELTASCRRLTIRGLIEKFYPQNRLRKHATRDQIRRALKRAMARYHPDRSRHLPTMRERVAAEETFQILHNAYSRVSD